MDTETVDFSLTVDLSGSSPVALPQEAIEDDATIIPIREGWHTKDRAGETVYPADAEDFDLGLTQDNRSQLEQLNDTYFVILDGGKHFVAWESSDPDDRIVLNRLRPGEFDHRLAGQFFGEKKLSRAWLSWSGHRQFPGGVIFDPTGSNRDPGTYNLWRGWPCPPKKGNWNIIRDHILNVICAGNLTIYRWMVGWLCALAQHPDRPGEVVPVLRGIPGCGKSIFGSAIRRMIGQHSLVVSAPGAVTGPHNEHLRDCLFLQADEAFFAGDHAATSVLKALITDPTLFVNPKGLGAFQIPNYLHILMTTNAEWAVPVAIDDRRFAVFDVSPSRTGDRAYFEKLAAAIQDDRVISAMLYDLLSANLKNFSVRDMPHTAARTEQQIHSLEGARRWLAEVLYSGDLGIPGMVVPGYWPTWVSTRDLQTAHEAWAAKIGSRRFAEKPYALGKVLTSFFKASRPRSDNPGRLPGYQLGTLDEARARFCQVAGWPRDMLSMDGSSDDDE